MGNKKPPVFTLVVVFVDPSARWSCSVQVSHNHHYENLNLQLIESRVAQGPARVQPFDERLKRFGNFFPFLFFSGACFVRQNFKSF